MKYISTRGGGSPRGFCDILLEGLAPDGGLYWPVEIPRVDAATLARWRGLSYADLAFEILSLYIDDIPPSDLRELLHRTYTAEVFGGDARITPLRDLDGDLKILALSQGPTLAFKDMAMQLLGGLFEYELRRRGQRLNILGATSGDTGSAAEYAMRGREGVQVFMLSPLGRMSPFQQAQMFSLQDPNIHNLAVAGVFDDCQDLVKAVSADAVFKRDHAIGTVNSINWARLLAQVVYYFAGYFQATSNDTQPVSFAVPSGNFGNICAGHVARRMGLPVDRLVLATNENRVLDEFFKTGVYRVRSSADTFETSSPSMDISKASNFERFVFDLIGQDAAQVKDWFGRALNETGQFAVPEATRLAARDRHGVVSGFSTHAQRVQCIATVWTRHGQLIDPHTADGVVVARPWVKPGQAMIVLETALPAKFADTLREATGQAAPRPPALQGLEALPQRVHEMPADLQAIRAFIEAHPGA